MADKPERLIWTTVGRRRVLATTAIVFILLCVAWAICRHSSSQSETMRSAVVQFRPFSTTIDLSGTVIPGDSANVTAPFDGAVKSVHFAFGSAVEAGAVLVDMDTFDVSQTRDAAANAYLKAAQTAEEMASWANGAEVSRARRALSAAELDFKDTERKAAETHDLLDRGLVARNEYDGLVQQQRTQSLAIQTAREDLAAVVRRGEGPARLEATIELRSAKARLADIDAQLAGAAVKAPASGVIVRPPVEKTNVQGASLYAGERVSRGELLGVIAKAGGVGVVLHLNEADALRVHVGQAVEVSAPGLGSHAVIGRITSVAGEATPSPAGGGAMFEGRVLLDFAGRPSPPDVRIGMSANVSIVTYRNPRALVVPPEALIGAPPAVSVRVRTTGGTELRHISVGHAASDGVEVMDGLRAGETIVWPTPR